MASAQAYGTTTIVNAAIEPEVVQLCEVLQSAGVKIDGVGTQEIKIEGSCGELLEFEDIRVIPDRIEAGTYLCAGAITNSEITIKEVTPHDLDSIISKLQEMGFDFEIRESEVTIKKTDKIRSVDIQTTEHPGFPTDMQAQFMALSLLSDGVSVINERLFENRFMHVSELKRMGADKSLNGTIATIKGDSNIIGADVMATDSRASSA